MLLGSHPQLTFLKENNFRVEDIDFANISPFNRRIGLLNKLLGLGAGGKQLLVSIFSEVILF